MNGNKNEKLTPYAQKLRKNMTKEERHIWYDFLKQLPIGVNRQKIIGKYIVDFYCASMKTVIEIDGSQHFTVDGICESDYERDKYLSARGLTILRYSNYEINTQFDNVCQDILQRFNLCEKAFPFEGKEDRFSGG